MLLEDGPRRLGQGAEDRVPADPAEPVGRVAGVGLAAMGDAVPVGGEPVLAEVVGRLGGLVAGVPEVVDLEQGGRERQPRRTARTGQQLRESLFPQDLLEPRTAGRPLDERRSRAPGAAQGFEGEDREQIGRGEPDRLGQVAGLEAGDHVLDRPLAGPAEPGLTFSDREPIPE